MTETLLTFFRSHRQKSIFFLISLFLGLIGGITLLVSPLFEQYSATASLLVSSSVTRQMHLTLSQLPYSELVQERAILIAKEDSGQEITLADIATGLSSSASDGNYWVGTKTNTRVSITYVSYETNTPRTIVNALCDAVMAYCDDSFEYFSGRMKPFYATNTKRNTSTKKIFVSFGAALVPALAYCGFEFARYIYDKKRLKKERLR